MTIARAEIEQAARTIAPYVRVTPVLQVRPEDFGLTGFALQLKLECLQHSGSFKARGAFASLLLRDVPAAGVVAASGGNHGAAVAYAAMRLGVPAKIRENAVHPEMIRMAMLSYVERSRRYRETLREIPSR